MKNSKRIMVKIIKEICAEQNMVCESFSYDWILRLSKNGKTVHIYGYQFENNSATAQLICMDKCATSELLLSKNIPAVEHRFFITPKDMQYLGGKGNWQSMLDLLKKHGRLVCKPNDGTGGKEVYLVSTPAELEIAVNKIFSKDRAIALCPFYEIENEYRAILLNQQVKLIYSKSIPTLIGDGISSLGKLFSQYVQSYLPLLLENSLSEETIDQIPDIGEKVPINWKHNLGQGSSPEVITDSALVCKLSDLAIQATQVVNVKFASVDIIKSGGKYMVLEINSGIMMESFAELNQQNYQIAKNTYQGALNSLFGLT